MAEPEKSKREVWECEKAEQARKRKWRRTWKRGFGEEKSLGMRREVVIDEHLRDLHSYAEFGRGSWDLFGSKWRGHSKLIIAGHKQGLRIVHFIMTKGALQ
jgi:hypothetical protein